MSTFSRQEDYSITLNDPLSSLDTITITSSGSDYSYYSGGSVTTIGAVGASGGSTFSITSGLGATQINTISNISITDLSVEPQKEFVNCMPDFDRIEKMCKEYPGLKIAFEKFKTTYYLVKDDYDTPKDQRVKP